MAQTKLGERFFDTTRGRIVNLLHGSSLTVNELAENLGLTDNAVRAHLLALDEDGLVKQSGIRRGFRKPHFAYELTVEGERLFPKAYDLLLNRLLVSLKERMEPVQLQEVLREVGSSLASPQAGAKRAGLETRVTSAVNALNALGGAATTEKVDGQLYIQSGSCPLSAAVAEHPEVCQLAEALVAEILGAPVKEHCERVGKPRCRFEIKNTP